MNIASASMIKLAAFLLTLPLATVCHAEPLPTGKAKLKLKVQDKEMEVFTYRPASYQDGPLLLVMHGLGRNAEGYRDYAIKAADQLHALVVAPYFSKKQFPTADYQRGGILKDGKPRPREQWTFQFVRDIATEVRKRESRPDMPLYLLGHSAGGQILSRMAAFLPGDAQRIVAANPGSLLFPTREQTYPYGFGGLPPEWSGDEQIKAYLAAPLTLYLGTADVLPKDLDQSPDAMRQGSTRFARGHACFDMAQSLAKEHGWPFHWRLVEAPDIGHTASGMFSQANAIQTFSATSDKN